MMSALLLICSSLMSVTMATSPIYFSGFFPLSSPSTESLAVPQGVMPAVRLALRHINANPLILPKYNLRMLFNDTRCDPGLGLKSFFDAVATSPKKLLVFGATCSSVTEQISKAARQWRLVQLTYADTHPMFTERVFPSLFRVVPSENEYNAPRLSLLKYFNWTRVGTLYQNEARYSLAHNNLVLQLERNGFEVVAAQNFNDELTNQLDILLNKDIRIILGNFNETWARRIFCHAFQKKLFGGQFQWLIVGVYQSQWWTIDNEQLECTQQQMVEAVSGTILVEMLPLSSDEKETVSGLTPQQYEEEYGREAGSWSILHGYAYDGVWSIALALDKVANDGYELLEFDYRNATWERLLTNALDQTVFEGVTGPVRFRFNSRRGNVLIKQLVKSNDSSDLDENCVGEYSAVTRTLRLEKCGEIHWASSRPPRDRTVRVILEWRLSGSIYAVFCSLSLIGIVLALVFLSVNVHFRHQRHIKMSSPHMNNLIIIGSILTYSSVILLGLDSEWTSEESFPLVCTARAWILMAGFTLSFGSMFSKTWRVHSIFTNVQLNKKVMKDYQLYLVVGALVCIDVITMTTWQVFDPFYRATSELAPLVSELGVQIVPRIEHCRSDHMTLFVGCIYAYKGLLMLFGAFLAWETRHVQIPALNDSKYVGMSVYNVAIMCVLGVAVSFVLSEAQLASFIIISAFIIFCTTGTLCLVFLPKIIEIRRDAGSELSAMANRNKAKMATLNARGLMMRRSHDNADSDDSLDNMLAAARKLNFRLRNALVEIEKEIKCALNVAAAAAVDAPLAMASLSPLSAANNNNNANYTSNYGNNGGNYGNDGANNFNNEGDYGVSKERSEVIMTMPSVRRNTLDNNRSVLRNNECDSQSHDGLVCNTTNEAINAMNEINNGSLNNGMRQKYLSDSCVLEDHATQTTDEFEDYCDDHNYLRLRRNNHGNNSANNCLNRRSKSLRVVDNDENEDQVCSREMLPIFHRLIEDKRKRSRIDLDEQINDSACVRHRLGLKECEDEKKRNGASCPDISLKCDVIEYL